MGDLAQATRPGGVIIIVGAWRVSTLKVVGWLVEQRLLSRIRGRRIRFFVSQRDQADLAFLRDLLASGAINPPVERTYPFVELAEAIRHLERFRTKGKIVVTM
jgi:NADPH:quinone reductase-like Zn-dependent oxidoreductase